MREMHRTVEGLSLAAAILLGVGAAHAQSAADIEAVTAANSAYYTALSALDLPSIEKAWVHEDYDALAGPAPSCPPDRLGGNPIYAKNVDNLAEISVKPVDVHIRINGNSAWTISRGSRQHEQTEERHPYLQPSNDRYEYV